MKTVYLLLVPLSLSCVVSACTHDYGAFDTTGTGGGTGGNTGGTGGSGTGGMAGSATGGAAGSATGGTGGLDAGADAPGDAPDDVSPDVAADAEPDAPVPCTEQGALTWAQNGHCYFALTGQGHDWFTQRDRCTNAGAHLVTITSQGENDFVQTLVGYQDRWIGLYRAQAGDPFTWVTGEPLGYTDWVAGEPNEPGESCGRITSATPSWRDRACNQSYGAICERP